MGTINKVKHLHFPQIFNMTDASGLNPEIFTLGHEDIYPKGAILLRVGELPAHIYYLHHGTVFCYRSADDRMNLTYILKNGFFADCWYFARMASEDEVIVEEESRITVFRHDVMDRLLAIPGVAAKIMHTLAIKSITGIDLAENIRSKSVKARLKRLIQDHLQANGEDNSLILNLSQKAIASLMGVHPVSISRALSELKKEMSIETSKNRIVIRR